MKKTIAILVTLMIFFGCGKDNHVDPTFVLTIVDKSSAPVSGATVNVYLSQDDYTKGIIKETFTSDGKGQISTTNAQFASGNLMSEALKGDLITWPAYHTNGGSMDYKLTLADNNYYKELVGSHWILKDVTNNGTTIFSNVSACSKDNYILFNKNLTVEFNEGASLCSGMTQAVTGTYVPNPKDPASLSAMNSQLVYFMGLEVPGLPGVIYLSSTLDKLMLVEGTVVNVYKKN